MLAHHPSVYALSFSALALGACDDLPRPTITDGRGPDARPVAVVAPPSSATPEDTVTLRFDWPDSIDAAVKYTLKGTAVTDGTSEEFTHALSAKKVTGGWEVAEEGPLEGSDYTSAELILRGELLAPSLVGPDGSFSGVLDAAKMHDVGKSEMRARYEREGALAMFERGIAKALTPAVVSRRSASIWRSIVGHWAGKTLTRGVPIEVAFSSPIGPASAAQRPLDLVGELRYIGPTRCFPKQVKPRCVALSLKAKADPDAMATSVVESITAAMPGGEENRERIREAVKIDSAEALREVTLVTDPNTLLPYRAVVKQALVLNVTLQLDPSTPSQSQESKIDHEVTRVFTYR